jgi:sigma-B regulation protein RsbU (phosphoserine phosphatase)
VAHLRLFRGNRPQRVELTNDSYVLGRSHSCDIVLESDAVSRRHARITYRNDTFILEDLGSRNKTYLNGNLIAAPAELADNDIIRICNHHIIFLCDSTTDSSRFQVVLKGGKDDSTRIKVLHDVAAKSRDLGLDEDARPREKLEAFLEINRSLSTVNRGELLLTRVLDCLFRIFPQTDRCYILMRSETGATIPRAAKNRHGPPDTSPRLSQTILHHVFDNGRALLAEDAQHDPDLAQHGSVMDNLIHSIMCAPLPGDGLRPGGAIWMHTEDRARQFCAADLDLLVCVASMVSLGLQRGNMYEKLLDHDRRVGESEAGRNVQQMFLPIDWPSVPGYRFYANCRPALSVGGDYFGFTNLSESRMAIALGDVSGNGMAAALLMARLSSELRFAAINSSGPGEAVSSLNRILQSDWPADRFVTLLYAELDRSKASVALVNAGHMPPLLRSADGDVRSVGEAHAGPPLNAAPNHTYAVETISLEPGEILMFYSDGISDAMNPLQERFGRDRIQHLLSTASGDPGRAGDAILQAVLRYLQGGPQRDDMAVVCFGREVD